MRIDFFVGIQKTYIETHSKDIREIVQTAVDFVIANQPLTYPPEYYYSCPPKLFKVREICDQLSVSKTKVYDLIRSGVLTAEIHDRLIKVHDDSLLKWCRENGRVYASPKIGQ